MVVIKDMEMPKGCQRCKFFRKHMFGNGLDYSYSCVLGATEFPMPWIRQMEERASDCPLVEIITCKDCKHNAYEIFKYSNSELTRIYCKIHKIHPCIDDYCADGESEDKDE